MITATISLLSMAIGQQLVPSNAQEHQSTVLILAPHQSTPQLKESLKGQPLTEQFLKDQYGITVIKYEVQNQIVFVSESVTPLSAYKNTAKLLQEMLLAESTQFKAGSEIGKKLHEYTEAGLPGRKLSPKPDEKCFGVMLALNFQVRSQAFKMPVIDFIGEQPTSFDSAASKKIDIPRDELSLLRNKQNPFFPSQYLDAKYSVTIYPDSRRNEAETLTLLNASNVALRKAIDEITPFAEICGTIYNKLLGILGSKLLSDFQSQIYQDENLNRYPKEIQDIYRKQILQSYEELGFDSEQSALDYLNSNPKVSLKPQLSIFAQYDVTQPNGTTTRSGGWIIIANPNPNSRKLSPPP